MSSLSEQSGDIAGPAAMIALAGVAVILRFAIRRKELLAIEEALVMVSLVSFAQITGPR